jgi:hypothetical protein
VVVAQLALPEWASLAALAGNVAMAGSLHLLCLRSGCPCGSAA